MIVATVGLALAVVAGYLFGVERERDRQRGKTCRRAAVQQDIAAAGYVVSDREWERFVVAIYELADGGEQ